MPEQLMLRTAREGVQPLYPPTVACACSHALTLLNLAVPLINNIIIIFSSILSFAWVHERMSFAAHDILDII